MRKRILTLLIMLAMTLPLGLPGFAMESGKITRAETALELVNIMGAAGGNFLSDVTRPNEPVTREEAFDMLAKTIKLSDSTSLSKFTDAAEVSKQYYGSVAALVSNNYIKGIPAANGTFVLNPKGTMTRGEFAALLDTVFQGFIISSGTTTKVADGNIVVKAAGAILKDLTVKGDLIIADSVGNGEVTLDNVAVQGRLVIRGGGKNSINVKGASVLGEVIVARADGAVSVKIHDNSAIQVIYVTDGEKDVIISGDVNRLVVQTADTPVTLTGGMVGSVTVASNNAEITVATDSIVTNLSVAAKGVAIDTEYGSCIELLNVASGAVNLNVTGNGSITKAVISSSNASIESAPATTIVGSNISGTEVAGNSLSVGSTAYLNTEINISSNFDYSYSSRPKPSSPSPPSTPSPEPSPEPEPEIPPTEPSPEPEPETPPTEPEPQPETLAQVTGVTLSNTGLATWTDLADETGLVNYSVQLLKSSELISEKTNAAGTGTTGISFLAEMRASDAGSYTVIVTAIGNGTTHNSGEASSQSEAQVVTQLSPVTEGLIWLGDTARWTDVDASSYSVQLYKDGTKQGSPQTGLDGVTGVDFTSEISDAGFGTYTYTVTAKGDGMLLLDAAESARSNENTKVATFTVTLNVYKDTTSYAGHGKTFTMKNGADEIVGSGLDGTVTFEVVEAGIWRIYDGAADTGKSVTVTNQDVTATLDYFTLTFSVTDKGDAAGSTVSSNLSPSASSLIVLSGTNVTLTAVGAGAPGTGASYTFAWSASKGTIAAPADSAVLTHVVFEETALNCNVTGIPGTFTVTLNVYKDTATYTGYTKVFTLKNNASATSIVTGSGTDGIVAFIGVGVGTWSLFDGNTDTGKDITVTNKAETDALHYNTVTFYVIDEGIAEGSSTISSNQTPSASPAIVLRGSSVILTVVGAGREVNIFSWAVNGISVDEQSETFTWAVMNPLTISCVVIGID